MKAKFQLPDVGFSGKMDPGSSCGRFRSLSYYGWFQIAPAFSWLFPSNSAIGIAFNIAIGTIIAITQFVV